MDSRWCPLKTIIEAIGNETRFTLVTPFVEENHEIPMIHCLEITDDEIPNFICWIVALMPTHSLRKRPLNTTNYTTLITMGGETIELPHSAFIAPYLDKDHKNTVFRIHPLDAPALVMWCLRQAKS